MDSLQSAIKGIIDSWVTESQSSVDEILTLSSAQVPLHRQGRRHSRIFTRSPLTLIAHLQIGICRFVASIGWNTLDLPDGTLLSLSEDIPQKVLYRVSDD